MAASVTALLQKAFGSEFEQRRILREIERAVEQFHDSLPETFPVPMNAIANARLAPSLFGSSRKRLTQWCDGICVVAPSYERETEIEVGSGSLGSIEIACFQASYRFGGFFLPVECYAEIGPGPSVLVVKRQERCARFCSALLPIHRLARIPAAVS